MGSKVDLKNSTVRLDEFNRRIDNSFKYFAEQETPVDTDTVTELFRLYDKLYLEIPATGDNSHQTLVERSSEIYITDEDPTIQLLRNEITDLRRQLLEANESIVDLSNINTNLESITTNG
jgi:hypothetical protein